MSPLVQNVTDFLSYLTVLSDVFVIVMVIVIAAPLRKMPWFARVKGFFGDNAILFSFLVGIGSVAGSLFYSQVAHFEPCFLCWIQRALLYTEAVIFLFALIARGAERVKRYDHLVRKAAIVLSSVGALVSIYNIYLQFGGSSAVNCAAFGTVSCELVYFVEYGYITIPTMALTAFALIIVFMVCGEKA